MIMQSENPMTAEAAKSFDLFELPDGYYDDPYKWFALLREKDPVHLNRDDSVLLTRYDDVRAVWSDLSASVDKSDVFKKKFGPGPLLEHHTSTILFSDPPRHDELRMMVNPFFSRKNIRLLEEFIESRIEERIDFLKENKRVEFVQDFAFQIPMQVICRILGVPESDRDFLHRLGMKIIFPLNPHVCADTISDGNDAVVQFKSYLQDFLDDRAKSRPEPNTDVIASLLEARHRGAKISDEEIFHMCIILLNGGHETTTNTLAIGLLGLLQNQSQISAYRNGEASDQTAADELIRFVTPIQLQGRRLTRALTLPSGPTLPSGTEVILCPASANRDPSAFYEPNKIDLLRKPNMHFAFGAGVHLCIGRLLAKLQISKIFPALFNTFSQIELLETARFNKNARFRGLQKLQLELTP